MKAIVKKTPFKGNTELCDIPKPKAGRKQVVVKVEAAGLCGTDLRFYTTDEGKTKLKTPIAIGHEGSGTVVEVGEGVTDVKVGDRVVCETSFELCGKCEYCTTGYYNMCVNRTSLGSKVDGFFAEYVLCNSDRIHKLPDNVSFEAGAMVEPLSCCVHGVLERSSLKPLDVCVVYGPGPLGIMAAQVAKVAGARVILVGTKHSKPRLELAKKMGIEETLVTGEDDIDGYIRNITNGLGADVVIECSGSGKALDDCFKIVKRVGEVLLLSAPSDYRANLWDNMILKEVSLVGFISSKPTSWVKSLKLLERGLVDVESLISHKFSIDDWKEAFELGVSKEAIKIIIYPNK